MSLFFAMMGVGGTSRNYTLSSTNTATDSTFSPTDANVQWEFNADGTVDRTQGGSTVQFQAGVEWTDEVPPGQDVWIQFTAQSGDVPNGASSALTTWHVLVGAGSATRIVEWNEARNGNFSYIGAVTVKIATDALGSNVVATGIYGGSATVEV